MGSFMALFMPLLVKKDSSDLWIFLSFKIFGINLKTPMEETGCFQEKSEDLTIKLSSLGMLDAANEINSKINFK